MMLAMSAPLQISPLMVCLSRAFVFLLSIASPINKWLNFSATENGDRSVGGVLSFLPGQRLSRCTCPGESHPGPMHSDGTFVGRSAPEIDVFEAQITGEPLTGQVSQSAQWAPFNAAYAWFNTTANLIIPDPDVTVLNPYMGGAFQQATSGVTETDQGAYEGTQGTFSVYGFEYKPGFDDAYIGWIANDKLAWRLNVAGMKADTAVEISDRPVPQEPMVRLLSKKIIFVRLTEFATPSSTS